MKKIKNEKKKRKTKKGFTLVELLAVIVILAIVVGITLVTVLPTLKSARQEAFQLSAEIAAEYLEKQYQLSLVGSFAGEPLQLSAIPTSATEISSDDLIKAGLKPENYISATWYIDTNVGRACVYLEASTNETKDNEVLNLGGYIDAGEYYDVTPNSTFSKACSSTEPSGYAYAYLGTDVSDSIYESSDGINWYIDSSELPEFTESELDKIENYELNFELRSSGNYEICAKPNEYQQSYVSLNGIKKYTFKYIYDWSVGPESDEDPVQYDCYDLGSLSKGDILSINADIVYACTDLCTTLYYEGGIEFYMHNTSTQELVIIK